MNKHLPAASRISRIECEANLDGNLPVLHGGLIDIAPHLLHLKPAQAVQRFTRAFECVADRLLNRLRGRSGQLDDFVNVIVHSASKIRASFEVANRRKELVEILIARRGKNPRAAFWPG